MAVATGNTSVDVRLERIQAAVDVGNAETKGALAVLVLRSDQSEKVADERARVLAIELRERDARIGEDFKERDARLDKAEARADKTEARLSGLSKQVWIMGGGIGALCGSAGVIVQILMHK